MKVLFLILLAIFSSLVLTAIGFIVLSIFFSWGLGALALIPFLPIVVLIIAIPIYSLIGADARWVKVFIILSVFAILLEITLHFGQGVTRFIR